MPAWSTGGGGGGGGVTRGFDLLTANASTDSTSFVRVAARTLNVDAVASKTITLKATIENAAHSTSYRAEVRLFNATSNTVIAASTLDNSLAANRALPLEVSAVLASWPSGNFTCEVQLRAAGSTGESERAIIGNARLEIT
jgi:hypothetical protein